MLTKLQNPKMLMSTALILLLVGISVGFIIGLTSSGSTQERYIALDSGGAIINASAPKDSAFFEYSMQIL